MAAEPLYVIRRESAEPETNPGDVYVTGPHFGTPLKTGTYSSTRKASEASRFTADQVDLLMCMGKWRHENPRIIRARDAVDLEDAKGGDR